jgi:hypothetical protein
VKDMTLKVLEIRCHEFKVLWVDLRRYTLHVNQWKRMKLCKILKYKRYHGFSKIIDNL